MTSMELVESAAVEVRRLAEQLKLSDAVAQQAFAQF